MSTTVELHIIDKTVFQDMLEEFGGITTWTSEQVNVLMEKAKEVYGKGMVFSIYTRTPIWASSTIFKKVPGT